MLQRACRRLRFVVLVPFTSGYSILRRLVAAKNGFPAGMSVSHEPGPSTSFHKLLKVQVYHMSLFGNCWDGTSAGDRRGAITDANAVFPAAHFGGAEVVSPCPCRNGRSARCKKKSLTDHGFY